MIKCINLDSKFTPTKFQEIEFDLFQFSGGEWHIKVLTKILTKHVVITCRVNSMDDFMKVLLAKDALERIGVKSFDLIMPYIPYARQDRVCNDGESFSLKVFTHILNAAKFNKVTSLDAHSGIAPVLIDNYQEASLDNFIIEMGYSLGKLRKVNTCSCYRAVLCTCKGGFQDFRLKTPSKLALISPDLGAVKKLSKLKEKIDYVDEFIICNKYRDTETGRLSNFEVFTNNLEKKDCLIMDDICDGGATFIGVAKALKKKNAGDLYLFITHGIFSKGFDDLLRYYKHIYTTDSVKDYRLMENITQFKIRY